MKLSEIQELVKFIAKSGVSEVAIEDKDFKITIKTPPKGSKNQPVETQTVIQTQVPVGAVIPTGIPPQAVPQVLAPVAAATPPAAETNNYIEVKSPMIGTFYRKPSPDKPSFVNVGDDIKEDSVVCVIEAMKLFNEIEAEISGKIVKTLVDDGSPVEYDQPLFLVDPS